MKEFGHSFSHFIAKLLKHCYLQNKIIQWKLYTNCTNALFFFVFLQTIMDDLIFFTFTEEIMLCQHGHVYSRKLF